MPRSAKRLVLIVLLLAAVSPLYADDTPEANKNVVRQVIEEVLNQGRLERADELVSDAGDGRFGPDWFRTTYRMRRSAFPDLTYRIEEMLAEGDRVVVRFTAVGTPDGPVVQAPSEDRVEVPGVAIFEVRGGKITDGWELTDMLKLMRQTGYTVQPPQASPASSD